MAQLAVVASQGPARSHSGYRLIVEPGRKRVRAVFNGETVADSDRVLVMHESGYRPVTYGNIGSAERLDFTIVGTAVNHVARIEAITKVLRRPVLISSTFATSFGGELISVGRHRLRGVAQPQEIFTA